MKNQEIAKLLYRLADILEIEKVEWKPRAYRRAAQAIETLSYDIEDAYGEGSIKALMEIPGVGKNIAEKIEEYLKTGKIKELEIESKKIPAGLEQLLELMGLGPKKIAVLYEKLKIKNVKDLEKAAKEHKIAKLEGFGVKSEENILEAISYKAQSSKRVLLSTALLIADKIKSELKIKEIKNIEVMGSLRRMKETIGDIDILVTTSKPKLVMEKFVSLPDIARVIGKGTTKTTVILNNGMQADLRVVDDKIFGAALLYFTGSQAHNVALRRIAISKGLKLSEYGLFERKTEKLIAAKTEEEIYKKLGLSYIEPKMREDKGEIESAQANHKE